MSLNIGDNVYLEGIDTTGSFPVTDMRTSVCGGWGSNPDYSAIYIDGQLIIFDETGTVVGIT